MMVKELFKTKFLMSNIFIFSAILIILFFVICVLLIGSWWKIFTKANQRGWAILLPIYNLLIMLKIAKKPWWWIFLFFIPGINILMVLVLLVLLSKTKRRKLIFIFTCLSKCCRNITK